MKKKVLILLLILASILTIQTVSADITTSLNTPGNNTWDVDGTVTFNCTVQINESNESITNLSLWGNWNLSTWALITTNTTAITNATGYIFTTNLQNGTWLWNCEGYTNNSESAFASANYTINVDSVNPVVNALNNYGDDTWTTSTNITFGFNTTDNNPDTCVLYHNASGTFVANVTASYTNNTDIDFTAITFSSDGHYLWNVLCNDSAGNTDWFTNNYTLKIDSTNPTISLDAPGDNTWDSDGSVIFQYTPTDTNIDSCILYTNSTGSWVANITNSSLNSGNQVNNTLSLSDGTYIWNVQCNDSAGNAVFNGTNYTINVDTSAITVNSLNNYDDDTWTTSRTVIFGFNVTDNNLDTCVLYHNASGWAANVTNSSVTSNEDTNFTSITFSSDGTYLWNVLCNDSAGNTDWFTSNYTLKVDSGAPVISSITNSSITSSGATITWITNEAANSSVAYGTNSSNLNSSSGDATTTTSHSISLTSLSASTAYYYNVTSCDASGNCNTSGPNNFTTSAATTTTTTTTGSSRTTTGTIVTKTTIGTTPKTVTLKMTDKALFTVDNEIHTAQINRIYQDHVTITVRSLGPINVDLYYGKTAKVDINDDGIFDITITLEEIFTSSAKITFQLIKEEVPESILKAEDEEKKPIATIEEREPEPIAEEPEEKVTTAKTEPTTAPEISTFGKILNVLVVIIVLAAIFGVIYFIFRKKSVFKK
ncbi:fibronectin type III domain-containing protein [Candidatus Woesearchaeota archaeon]|nr:fibronectin type III domain-containing protein [Candidatus Woesearchaeota archaeon]